MTFKQINTEAKKYQKLHFWKLLAVIILNSIISFLLSFLGNLIENSVLAIAYIIIETILTVPLSYGVLVCFIKNSRGEKFSISDFITEGMANFKMVWKVVFRTFLKMILPIILMIIGAAFSIVAFIFAMGFSSSSNLAGICIAGLIAIVCFLAPTIYYMIKSFSYSLAKFILCDNSDGLTAKEMVEESKTLMKGNKMLYFLMGVWIVFLYIIIFIVAFLMIAYLSLVGKIVGIILLIVGYLFILPYSYNLEVAFYNVLTNKKQNNATE